MYYWKIKFENGKVEYWQSEDFCYNFKRMIKGEPKIQYAKPITKIVYSIKERVDTYLKRTQYINYNFLKKLVINVSQFFIWSNKKKHPLIRTTIFDLSKDQQQTTNKKS